MTEQQTVSYEYCADYLKCLAQWKEKLPFRIQKYGCGTGAPSIEYKLEELHRKMFESVIRSIDITSRDVKEIIKEL